MYCFFEVIMLAKKSAAKKAAAKKKEAKKTKKVAIKGIKIEINVLRQAPKGNEFILADGRVLKDIKELAFALSDMADEVFWHHVNDARNDFAYWIEDTLKNSELAEDVKKVKDKWNAQLAILKHIVKKL